MAVSSWDTLYYLRNREGYFFDDPYPGYGKFYGEFNWQTRRVYQKLYRDKFDELDEIEQEQESRLTGLTRSIRDLMILCT